MQPDRGGGPRDAAAGLAAAGAPAGPDVARALDLLALGGLDLADYRPAALAPRLEARAAALGLPDAAAYVERLREDPAELARLADALLVQVTSFFRDPDVFAALDAHVLPRLLRRAARENRPLRAWSVGTSTGQEACSLALLLADLAPAAGVPFEVLATDRSEAALAYARRGDYTAAEVASLPPARAARLVRDARGGGRLPDDLRARIRFVRHDLLGPRLAPREAVLASFDLVLCRNVLIYLAPRAQALALARLAEVLPAGGALGLGLAEGVPPGCGRFTPHPDVAPGLRLYARTADGAFAAPAPAP